MVFKEFFKNLFLYVCKIYKIFGFIVKTVYKKTSYFISCFLCILIKVYQRTISPYLGNRCRFYPSCSNYALLCLKKYNLFKACFKIVYRLIRCQPFNSGGVDLP